MLYSFIAASGTPVRFDLRKEPRNANRDEFYRHQGYSVLSQPVKCIRLLCREFPWPIEIMNERVTCGTVWTRIHAVLQEPITASEWTMASPDKQKQIEKARQRRAAETRDRDGTPRRIDWLGEMTVFVGLEKDDRLVRQMTMPGMRGNGIDTWVIRLTK